MKKHPTNREERRKLDEAKKKKRIQTHPSVEGEREGLDSSLSLPDEGT